MIRITAPLHDGFAGGAVFGASGTLLGIATAAQIRGYAVVIPASIAWAAAAQLLVSGTPRRGFIGVAVQAVELPQAQRASGRERALLVVGVTPSGPAESAGVNVGDLILEVDGKPVASSDELLDRLAGRKAGETIVLSTSRGGAAREAVDCDWGARVIRRVVDFQLNVGGLSITGWSVQHFISSFRGAPLTRRRRRSGPGPHKM